MNAQQFLAEFGHVAKAPGGIDRLRDLILQLAVAGDLVSFEPQMQDLQMLERILQQKRDHGEKKKVIPKQASVPRGMVNAPPHWNLCRLGDIALTITGGGTPSKSHPEYWHGEIPWASVKDLKDYQYLDGTEDHITQEGVRNSSANLIPPGRVIVCTRMGLGKAAINRVAMAINQDLKALELPEDIDPDFFLLVYKTREVKGAGMTVAGIKQDKLLALPVAIPPKEEQSRIVARVDELIALCDQLEQQQKDRRKLQNALRQSNLQALTSAQSPHELQTSWQRLQANFGRLFGEPEDLRDFKGLVLDLAVNGRLLSPGSTPVAASGLLDQIAEARLAWAKTAEGQEKKEAVAMLNKLRTQQVAVPSDPLPEHWCWAPLLRISQSIVDCHNKTAPYVSEGIHLVRTSDIRDGKMDLTRTRKISEDTYAYWARRMPPRSGDIFFTREAPMGEAAIVPDGERVCLGQRTMLIRLFEDLFSNRYLLYVIQSPNFQARMTEAAVGMTVKHLRVGGVEDLVIPVPPRDEQDQIVRIVDSLFGLCDQHADHLNAGLRVAASLASSTVAALTGIAIEQDEETAVKVPETELIAPLRLATAPDVKAKAPLATLLARHQGEMAARDLWQRFGGEIDAFYAQVKAEVAHGWIAEPEMAQVREKAAAEVAKA
ncbi:MAG TPA: type I restriction endonuclease subunit R [Stenotrophomonas sp.]|nr:type I restriction endonuclease subunit R [Stenotrophomonas sp.]